MPIVLAFTATGATPTAQEVAHSFSENGGVNALQATSFVVCRRVRKKLRRGAQLLAHFLFVIRVGVR